MNYKSPSLCLYVFLPKEKNGLEEFEKKLTGQKIIDMMNGARNEEVIVSHLVGN